MFNQHEIKHSAELSKQTDNMSYALEPAEVIDIILDNKHPLYKEPEDIGLIKFRRFSASAQKSSIEDFARPLDTYIKSYPLLHEFVLITQAPVPESSVLRSVKRYYYLHNVNIWSLINHNVLPNASKKIESQTGKEKSNAFVNFNGNQTNKNFDSEFNFGSTFEENANVRPLQPYEGDVIHYGRFGQSIRFGSSVPTANIKNPWSNGGKNSDPIIIITNSKPIPPVDKLKLEDINKDASSIYICDGQQIPITGANTNQKSYSPGQKNNSIPVEKPVAFNSYKGKQIIITSDRLLFNARNESILLTAKNSIGLSSKTINIDADAGILFNTPKVYINATSNAIVNSPKIYLGPSADENAIMGPKFYEDIIKPLLQELIKMKVLTAFGPGTISPDHQAMFQQLITKLDATLSKRVFIEK